MNSDQDGKTNGVLQRTDSLLEAKAYKQAYVEIMKVMGQLNEEDDIRLYIEALELQAKIKRRVGGLIYY